jgi:S1-C subfamily serine protease
VVLSVEADAPAARAGVLVGDVVFAIDGQAVQSPEQVVDLLGTGAVGRTLALDLVRGGGRARADIVVGERPRRAG